ncbi:cell division protein FtsZ [Spirosoma harenae]
MNSQGYRFEMPSDDNPVIIKVIGVGGMGGNAVKHMDNMKMHDVSFAVCNTDRQALMSNPVKTKLQLGDGLGAGTEAQAGEDAARASIEEIENLLAPPTKMVFITAGMGGGTGTGAAPVVAEVARKLKLLTVAVVTAPYWYEGIEKKEQARIGIEKLQESCDTVLVVLNDKLAELYSELTWQEAYAHADDVLANAVKSIAEIITTQGDINADFADVKKVLQGAGQSVMGSAEAEGEDRALQAIEAALNSPLLNDHDILGAKRILLTISSSKKHAMKLKEQTAISEHVAKKIAKEARMFKFAAITDDNLGEKLRVTIIAAGFEGTSKLLDKLGPSDGNVEKEKTDQEDKTEEGAKDESTTTPNGASTDETHKEEITNTEEPKNDPPVVNQEPKAPEKRKEPVLVGPDGDDIDGSLTGGNRNNGVHTPTGGYTGGSTIVNPEPPINTNIFKDQDVDVLEIDEARPDDAELIRKTIEAFVKGQYLAADLDRPTFERNKTVLHPIPLLSDLDFVRSNLHD